MVGQAMASDITPLIDGSVVFMRSLNPHGIVRRVKDSRMNQPHRPANGNTWTGCRDLWSPLRLSGDDHVAQARRVEQAVRDLPIKGGA